MVCVGAMNDVREDAMRSSRSVHLGKVKEGGGRRR